MSKVKTFIAIATAFAALGSDAGSYKITSVSNYYKKPLTRRQKRKRMKSKASRKAIRINRRFK